MAEQQPGKVERMGEFEQFLTMVLLEYHLLSGATEWKTKRGIELFEKAREVDAEIAGQNTLIDALHAEIAEKRENLLSYYAETRDLKDEIAGLKVERDKYMDMLASESEAAEKQLAAQRTLVGRLVAALEKWSQVREHKACHCNACFDLRAALSQAKEQP